MLVLSRRPGEEFVFPALDITIRIVRVEGGTTRVAIDAPRDIQVMRGELLKGDRAPAATPGRDGMHELCNRLSKATLSLHLFEKLWHAGRTTEAESVLSDVLASLKQVDRGWLMRTLSTPDRKPVRCRTLVVDDDHNERHLLAGLLGMNGCECSTAADGDDALEYLAHHERPDFVLMDMWMPRRDGRQTLAAIRDDERFQGIKVFSISSTSPEEAGVAIGPQGYDAWFPKPLDPTKLWEAMQRSLNHSVN